MLCGVKRSRSGAADPDTSVQYGHDCLPSKRRSRRSVRKSRQEDKENAPSTRTSSRSTPMKDSFVQRPWVNSSFVPFFSPAVQRPDPDDTYSGMSLSYNMSSVHTASLNSQTYDCSMDSSISTEPMSPLNVSMVTASSTRDSRFDPIGSENGFSDTSYLSGDHTIPTPKQTLEWSAISESTMSSSGDRTLQMDKQASPSANTPKVFPSRSPVIVHRKIKGLLRIAVDLLEEDGDIVVVRVVEGKGIQTHNTFVQTQFLLDGQRIEGTARRSEVNSKSSSSVFNHTVTLTMSRNMAQQRLLVSVHEDCKTSRCADNTIGCMSFKVSSMVARARRQVGSAGSSDGWYCLLPEEIGVTKHMPLTSKLMPKIFGTCTEQTVNPACTDEVQDAPILIAMKIAIHKESDGYGFTVKGSKPVRVGRVTPGSSSSSSGLLHGDYILSINGKDVSKISSTAVAKVVRDSSVQVTLEILRPVTSVDKKASTTGTNNIAANWHPGLSVIQEDRTLERNARLSASKSQDSLLYNESHCETPATKWNPDISYISHSADPKSNFLNESILYEEPDEASFLLEEGFHTTNKISMDNSWIEDTAESTLNSVWSEPTSFDSCLEHDEPAQVQLVRCQQCFVNAMSKAVQQFSKPLRYRILRSHQHSTLFQNVEKLVVVCDWLLKDLNAVSEDSLEDVLNVISRRLNLVCEAFQIYLSGLPKALTLLQQLNKNNDFVAFLNSSYQKDFIMTIESFLEKPVQHILELVTILESFKPNSSDSENPQLDSVIAAMKTSVENAASADRKKTTLSRLSSSSVDSGISQCSNFSNNSRGLRGSSLLVHNACTSQHLNGSSGYMSMSRLTDSQLNRSSANVDQHLNDLQNKLQFGVSIKPFNVAVPNRHIVYNSDVTFSGQTCTAYLCNDLLLVTSRGASAQVVTSPVFLKDIAEMDFGDDNGSNFSLKSDAGTVELSAANSGDKHAWRSLLQHHRQMAKCFSC